MISLLLKNGKFDNDEYILKESIDMIFQPHKKAVEVSSIPDLNELEDLELITEF